MHREFWSCVMGGQNLRIEKIHFRIASLMLGKVLTNEGVSSHKRGSRLIHEELVLSLEKVETHVVNLVGVT